MEGHPVLQLQRLQRQAEAESMEAEPQDATYGEGLKALRNSAMLDSPKWAEQQDRANRKGCHQDILAFERAFIARMQKLGVPMFCHTAQRTMDEQNAAFVRGVSRAKAGKSAHNYGCAVDIVHSVKAWDMTREQWALLGHIGKEIASGLGADIEWGGDWKFYDPAHWEVRGWKFLIRARFN